MLIELIDYNYKISLIKLNCIYIKIRLYKKISIFNKEI